MPSRVEGLDRLKRRWARIPAQVKAATKPALHTGADELVAMQKRLAPVDEGDLVDSIRKEAGAHELQVLVKSGGTPGTRKGVFDNAVLQEFGTQDMPANASFYPAYRTLRRRIRGRINRAMKKAIQAG
jgi:HK97 gp10 family phage protein